MLEQQVAIKPDPETMIKHLEFLFGGDHDCSDGKIEIAYTDASGKPNQAQYFSIADIEKAVDFAAEKNEIEGVNIYVGAALRRPDIAPFGRSKIDDYYAATCVWADIDTVEADAKLKNAYKPLPPSFAVVTGRKPYRRTQLWWKLSSPHTDASTLKNTLCGLKDNLNGDPTVVDPARIMRLAGSVAWPHKRGRQAELTEAHVITETPNIKIEDLESTYPPKVIAMSEAQDGKPRDIITGTLDLKALLEKTKTPGEWHYNMRDAIASMIGKGWSDEQIRLACAPYCDSGAEDPDLTPLIQKGREKWNMPNPEHASPTTNNIDEATGEIKTLKATSIHTLDLDNIKPREFLYYNIVARKYVSMIIAPPGVGKSIFTLQMALSAASGKPWGEWNTFNNKPINVWIYNNEEGQDELRRRIKGCMIDARIGIKDVGNLYIDSGEQRSITIAKNIKGDVLGTPDFEAVKQEVLDREIDLLVIDPFAETHTAAENSNDEIKEVTRLYRRIAFETNCAVLLVHHTRKGVASNNEENAGNADIGRGGGAQTGVVRRTFTLAHMDKTDAEKLNIPVEDRKWFVRFDDAKTNITAPADKTHWFKFHSVNLDNATKAYMDGDSVGVLRHMTIEDLAKISDDKNAEIYDYVLNILTEYMMREGIFEAKMKDFVDYMQNHSSLKYKNRKCEDLTKQAIYSYRNKGGYVYSGYSHKYKIPEKRGRDNAVLIFRNEVKV